MPTERPILFNSAMVRALLDGAKTQTRRVIKPQPEHQVREIVPGTFDVVRPPVIGQGITGGEAIVRELRCPYGVPGDRLWCRETWAHYQTVGLSGEVSDGCAGYRADGFDSIEDFRSHVKDESEGEAEHVEINGDRWRPSIHMPRWASRITLEVTGVRVERVQDISGPDAIAEGINVDDVSCIDDLCFGGPGCPGAEMVAVDKFEELWDSINGRKSGCSWESSPWVWIVDFKRVTP